MVSGQSVGYDAQILAANREANAAAPLVSPVVVSKPPEAESFVVSNERSSTESAFFVAGLMALFPPSITMSGLIGQVLSLQDFDVRLHGLKLSCAIGFQSSYPTCSINFLLVYAPTVTAFHD